MGFTPLQFVWTQADLNAALQGGKAVQIMGGHDLTMTRGQGLLVACSRLEVGGDALLEVLNTSCLRATQRATIEAGGYSKIAAYDQATLLLDGHAWAQHHGDGPITLRGESVAHVWGPSRVELHDRSVAYLHHPESSFQLHGPEARAEVMYGRGVI